MHSRSVIPIPPSYNKDGSLNVKLVNKYVRYLEDNNASTVMTTAGTSQFNLLDLHEINNLNLVVSKFDGPKILGIPALNTKAAKNFIKNSDCFSDSDVSIMAIYPDRYYDEESIYSYFYDLRESIDKPLYLHAMFMRKGTGGSWDYEAQIISDLYNDDIICGIKEEYSDLQKSFNFISNLPSGLDIVVAGGSMRRHAFLRNAGAGSFLAGVGSFFPSIENDYMNGDDRLIDIETKFFKIFNKHGWHKSLRIGMNYFLKFSDGNRNPWPKDSKPVIDDVVNILTEIRNNEDARKSMDSRAM